MTPPDPHLRCLYAVGDGLRQRSRDAGQAARQPDATEADKARAFALLEIIALMLNEADDAGLDAADIGLGGFSPDLDLFGPSP